MGWQEQQFTEGLSLSISLMSKLSPRSHKPGGPEAVGWGSPEPSQVTLSPVWLLQVPAPLGLPESGRRALFLVKGDTEATATLGPPALQCRRTLHIPGSSGSATSSPLGLPPIPRVGIPHPGPPSAALYSDVWRVPHLQTFSSWGGGGK